MDITVYTKEDIKAKIKRAIDYYETRIEAWQNVKRVHKKDGSDFKVLSKNFVNCIFTSDYGWDRKLKVSVHENGHCGFDYIDLGDVGDENKIVSPDKIEEKIDTLLKIYQGRLKQEKKEYQMDDVIDRFCDTAKNALNELKSKSGDRSTLYYACREYMSHLY